MAAMAAVSTRLLRFIVFSSGDGTRRDPWLHMARLQRPTRRKQRVRYVLPTQLLKSLRKTNAPANVLMLTSYSPDGAQGESVTRRVAMQPLPKKPKPKKRA